MPIKQPRRFVTTDQGHADVLNVPIDTLYENDQALAEQIENIKNDPAGNDIASKAALDSHISDTNLHVTAAKQATWNAAEGNAKKYTEQYAAPKAHTHPASDLPSASTQARGIVQINTSVSSTSTDQAAAPVAVKTAYDRANEAYSRADQAFTQAVDLKNKIVGAINGKGGSANSGMNGDQIAGAINGLAVRKVAWGDFKIVQSLTPAQSYSPANATFTLDLPIDFIPTTVMLYMGLTVHSREGMFGQGGHGGFVSKNLSDPYNHNSQLYSTEGNVVFTLNGKTLTFVCGATSKVTNISKYTLYVENWCAYE